MKKLITTILYIISLSLICPLHAEVLSNGMQNLLNSVVRLDIWSSNYDSGSKKTIKSQGSGVIMSQDGYILTNAHVVDILTEKIQVTLANKEQIKASFIGWDHWTDLAVVKLDMNEITKKNITFSHATFCPPNQIEIGQTVYAVGTPFGLTRTITKGILSNIMRYLDPENLSDEYEKGDFNNWFQTDAAINPGNSGGPLVNEEGEVLGINTLVLQNSNNLGFAVPVQTAIEVYEILKKYGEVKRSTIGIQGKAMQELELEDGSELKLGLLIQNVEPGSPAKKAGMKPGDIILSINDQILEARFPEQIPPIMDMIGKQNIGSKMNLKIMRMHSGLELTLASELLESRIGEKFAFKNWGLTLEKLTRNEARERKLKDNSGFLVLGVKSAFPAAKSGLLTGDIIKKFNHQTINNMKDLKDLYNTLNPQIKIILLEIIRNNSIHYLSMKI